MLLAGCDEKEGWEHKTETGRLRFERLRLGKPGVLMARTQAPPPEEKGMLFIYYILFFFLTIMLTLSKRSDEGRDPGQIHRSNGKAAEAEP